jgi:hypothetical protein
LRPTLARRMIRKRFPYSGMTGNMRNWLQKKCARKSTQRKK